jgi:hypothetical protein
MIYKIFRQKRGEEAKIILQTSESHKALREVSDIFHHYEKLGQIIDGDLFITVKGRSPDKYLIVKSGVENSQEAFRFVKDHF